MVEYITFTFSLILELFMHYTCMYIDTVYRVIYLSVVQLFSVWKPTTQCYSDEIESDYICFDLTSINKTGEHCYNVLELSTYFKKCLRN